MFPAAAAWLGLRALVLWPGYVRLHSSTADHALVTEESVYALTSAITSEAAAHIRASMQQCWKTAFEGLEESRACSNDLQLSI